MEPRIDYRTVAPGILEAVRGLETYLSRCGIEETIILLIQLRASQINGCAYCIDMHWKDLRSAGESEQRLYGLDAWEESPHYTDRERAALAWTEAVTKICETHALDEVYEGVRKHFSEKDIANLTLTIATINLWNRLAISMRAVPGRYQPAKRREFREGARADAV